MASKQLEESSTILQEGLLMSINEKLDLIVTLLQSSTIKAAAKPTASKKKAASKKGNSLGKEAKDVTTNNYRLFFMDIFGTDNHDDGRYKIMITKDMETAVNSNERLVGKDAETQRLIRAELYYNMLRTNTQFQKDAKAHMKEFKESLEKNTGESSTSSTSSASTDSTSVLSDSAENDYNQDTEELSDREISEMSKDIEDTEEVKVEEVKVEEVKVAEVKVTKAVPKPKDDEEEKVPKRKVVRKLVKKAI
jgi:hypothetical protein